MIRLTLFALGLLTAAVALRAPVPLARQLGECAQPTPPRPPPAPTPSCDASGLAGPWRMAAQHLLSSSTLPRLQRELANFNELPPAQRLDAALDSYGHLPPRPALRALLIGPEEEELASALARQAGLPYPDTIQSWRLFLSPEADQAADLYLQLLGLARGLDMAWPVADHSVARSDYGWRIDPFDHAKQNFHGGIDFAVPRGTEVFVPGDGALLTGFDPNGGYWAIIEHGDGVSTLFCHLKAHALTRGYVRRGQLLAWSGNSGISTGPHLHWSVRIHNKSIDPNALQLAPHSAPRALVPPRRLAPKAALLKRIQ